MFVSMEGIDGSGKTTVAKMLVERLSARGANARYFKTPGQTPIGAHLREMLLNPDVRLARLVPFFLFTADHIQTVAECGLVDGPEDNQIASCDRYTDSAMVYQGMAGDIGIREGQILESVLEELLPDPDVTVLFQVKYETAQKRLKTEEFGKKDRYEDADRVKWESWQRAYLSLPDKYPDRKFVVVEVDNLTAEQVVDKLMVELFFV